jgi:hypothetical protein
MRNGIHGWIGGRFGSPTEYGLPLDDSYLYEEEEEDPEPQPCACGGLEWIGCKCQPDLVEACESPAPAGDDWTPVKIESEEKDERTFRQVLAGVFRPGLVGRQALRDPEE